MDKSAVILASGLQGKFSEDKGLLELNEKPLLSYVINAVEGLVEEIVVVTSSQEQADAYAKVVSPEIKFAVDADSSKGPLAGAIAGFKAANGEYSALLPVDSPFVSSEVLSLLFDCCVGKAADVPRFTNMEMEPLHAVYHTKQALQAAEEALGQNEVDLEAMVEGLRGVRYMSTLVIEQLDPDLKTFFRINGPLDLKKAAVMFKPRKTSKTKPNVVRNKSARYTSKKS